MGLAGILIKLKNKIFNIDTRSDVEIAIDNGMKVGKNFNVKEGCILDPGHVWLISVGDDVTLAPRVHLLAHDASTKILTGYTRIAPLTIGNKVFIGANTTVLPGVTIGDNVIIGANSTVTKDIPSGSVYAGNPAKYICSLEDYLAKQKARMEKIPVYDEKWTLGGGITDEMKAEQKNATKKEGGFVK